MEGQTGDNARYLKLFKLLKSTSNIDTRATKILLGEAVDDSNYEIIVTRERLSDTMENLKSQLSYQC